LPATASCLTSRSLLRRRLTLIMEHNTSKHLSLLGWAAVLALAGLLPLTPAPAQDKKPQPPASEKKTPPAERSERPATPNPEQEPLQFDANPTTLQPALGQLWSVAFAPDGKTLATVGGGWDKPGELNLW